MAQQTVVGRTSIFCGAGSQVGSESGLLIGKLYHVEAVARRAELDAHALKQLRQDRSVQVLGEIEALLLQHLHSVLPGSLLGKALHCHGITVVEAHTLRRRWQLPDRQQRLRRCEDAIRPFCRSASGAHTGFHLFSDSVAGAKAPTPARICTRCCRRVSPTGSTATGTSASCWGHCRAKTVDDYVALLPWRLTPKRA